MDFNRALLQAARFDLVSPGSTSSPYSGGWLPLTVLRGGGEVVQIHAFAAFRSAGETATTKLGTVYIETTDDDGNTDGDLVKDADGADMTFTVDGDNGENTPQGYRLWTLRRSLLKAFVRLRLDIDDDTIFVVGGLLQYMQRQTF